MVRKTLLLFAALLFALEATAATARHHKEQTFLHKPGGSLEIRAAFHDVKIVLDPSATAVKVVVDARLTPLPPYGERALEFYTPVFEETDQTIRVRCRPLNPITVGFRNASGTIEVTGPPGMDLKVDTRSGDIVLLGANPDRSLFFETGSGDVEVRGACRRFEGETGSGDVRLRLEGETESVKVETGSGDIKIAARAREVKAGSGSGDIRAEGLAGRADFETGTGDVEASWSVPPGAAPIAVETGSGNVRLAFPKGTALRGEVKTQVGSIRSDLPGSMDERGRRFTLAGGPSAADLSVETGSGDITLRELPSRGV